MERSVVHRKFMSVVGEVYLAGDLHAAQPQGRLAPVEDAGNTAGMTNACAKRRG